MIICILHHCQQYVSHIKMVKKVIMKGREAGYSYKMKSASIMIQTRGLVVQSKWGGGGAKLY